MRDSDGSFEKKEIHTVKMELEPFDVNETAPFYEEYYKMQDGQGLAVFRGRRHIEGDGIGSMLGGLFKAVAPTLKSVGKSALSSLGKQAMGVAKDVLAGKNFKESALGGLRAAGGEMLDDTVQRIGGGGRKRKRANTGGRRSKRTKNIL